MRNNNMKPKEITKSTLEKKNNAEEDEFKKYDAIVNKLAQAVINKDKPAYQIESDFSTAKRNPSIATRSNLKLTTSRAKDERNEKDFLTTLMNNDNDILTVSPNNLHLLSDNDTNKSISATEKFKNLSNLMIPDKDSFSEIYFIKNAEDRMILNLYSILGRKSKELFLEESEEKVSKIRLFLNKINDLKTPKFGFESNKQKKNNNELNQSYKIYEGENNKDISEEKKEDEQSDEDKQIENECYFKKKEKGYFIMPELVDELNYQKIRTKIKQCSKENYQNFWDPEIDADTLSNINHNMISIEDLYNNEETNEINKNKIYNIDDEEIEEENNITINAEEILTSGSENEEEKDKEYKNKEEEDIPKKGKVRFIEFYGVSPFQMGLSYGVDNKKEIEKLYNNALKEKYDFKLKKIGILESKIFPKNGHKLSNDLIYKIALTNDNNEIEENSRFTINASNNILKHDKSDENIKNLNKYMKKKLIIERKVNNLDKKGKLTDLPYTIKKSDNTIKNDFKSISDNVNTNKNIKNIYLEEEENKDSSLNIENDERNDKKDNLHNFINSESIFSNNSSIDNKNNSEDNIEAKKNTKINENNNEKIDRKNELFSNSSSLNSNREK